MKVIKQGSVRIDLLGGTLDLWPINLVLSDVVTLNMAIDLQAKVVLEKISSNEIIIDSHDYQKQYTFKESMSVEKIFKEFPEISLVMELLRGVGVTCGVKLFLQSDSPPGAGLGGSSTMGITLTRAINEFIGLNWSREKVLNYTRAIESKILAAGPSGYQDYYPALYGGILALSAVNDEIRVEQLFNEKIQQYLQNHTTLVYSGKSRLSGINNWEVYKKFFDGDRIVRAGLEKIAALSDQAKKAIDGKNFARLLSLMAEEGKSRMELFPRFVPASVKELLISLGPEVGCKMCGAGGGGCFLLIHKRNGQASLRSKIENAGMTILDYKITPPLSDSNL